MTHMARISVLIPAYNEERYIEACLRSIRAQTEKPYELIVINNNSKDKTGELAAKLADRIIFEPRLGVVHALNAGIKAARGDYVAITGADCIADKNWIKSIRLALRDEPVAVFGPIYSLSRRNKKLRFVYYFIWHVVAKTLSHTSISMAPGGNCALKRSAVIAAGGYDPAMVPGEDIELTKRIRKMGKLRFVDSAKVFASTRRFEENGVWKETKNWLKVFFRMEAGRPKTYKYFKYE